MGNRKENLKKSLGITEYPWSSDDDEDVPTAQQEVLIRSSGESRPSVADLPGTSGVQPQSEESSPATARRIQAKMDRDLFWSFINNTPKPHCTQPPRSRTSEPISSTSRSTQCPRPRVELRLPESRVNRRSSERPTNSVDVQRVLAFKKFTRSLQNLAQIRAASTTNPSQRPPTSSHSSPRSSRPSECFDHPPRNSQGQAAASYRPIYTTTNSIRDGFSYRPSWRRSLPIPPTYNNNNSNRGGFDYRPPSRRSLPMPPTYYDTNHHANADEEVWQYPPNDQPQPSTSANLDIASTSEMQQPYVNVDHSDDELRQVPIVPTLTKSEPRDEANENADEENNEEAAHNDTGSGARLIEEVVEVSVEGADEADNNNPPPSAEPDDEVSPTNESNNAGTVNSEENAEAAKPGSSYHGVKRKRDSTDDPTEPYTVHEFNQRRSTAVEKPLVAATAARRSEDGAPCEPRQTEPTCGCALHNNHSYTQNLLRLLECPVCLEWMEPPISQCRRGHLVCGRCRARLAACPVCRTPFSSVRNRAMEGVAEMLRYPCRHGCGREVRLRRRGPHEASCGARRYHCPAPSCARHPPLQRDELAHHFQCKHLPILKMGTKHKFSMKVNSEQHDTWLIMALNEYFHLRVDVDIRTWGVIVYVAYIGPKRNAKHYTYEVTVEGQHNSRRLVYTRSTHSDLESSSLNVSRQDCFHLTLDQALNFLRFKNRHCEPDKFLDFDVEITKWESVDSESKDDSDA